MPFVLQLKSKEEFDGCTGYEKVEKGNPDGGPFKISFDKVFAAAVLVGVVVLLIVVASVVIVVWESSFPFTSLAHCSHFRKAHIILFVVLALIVLMDPKRFKVFNVKYLWLRTIPLIFGAAKDKNQYFCSL